MTTNTTTSCQTNLRVEEKDKARNEALNRLILQHSEEVLIMQEYVDHYRNICSGLVLALVLALSGAGYSLYYINTLTCHEPVQMTKVVKEKVKKGDDSYTIKEYTLRK
jgi:hypothetical protein